MNHQNINKQINPLEYEFLTNFAHTLFTHSEYSERHREITLTEFSLSMRHIEFRISQGDVFADKLWHDMVNRLKLIQTELEKLSQEIEHVTLLQDKYYLFAFELGVFKSPLSEMIFCTLMEFDYFAARIMALYRRGEISKEDQFARINHVRNQLRNLMRMCDRISKPMFTRAMYRAGDTNALAQANQMMPKINLHSRLPDVASRHECAPAIYPDCV